MTQIFPEQTWPLFSLRPNSSKYADVNIFKTVTRKVRCKTRKFGALLRWRKTLFFQNTFYSATGVTGSHCLLLPSLLYLTRVRTEKMINKLFMACSIAFATKQHCTIKRNVLWCTTITWRHDLLTIRWLTPRVDFTSYMICLGKNIAVAFHVKTFIKRLLRLRETNFTTAHDQTRSVSRPQPTDIFGGSKMM